MVASAHAALYRRRNTNWEPNICVGSDMTVDQGTGPKQRSQNRRPRCEPNPSPQTCIRIYFGGGQAVLVQDYNAVKL